MKFWNGLKEVANFNVLLKTRPRSSLGPGFVDRPNVNLHTAWCVGASPRQWAVLLAAYLSILSRLLSTSDCLASVDRVVWGGSKCCCVCSLLSPSVGLEFVRKFCQEVLFGVILRCDTMLVDFRVAFFDPGDEICQWIGGAYSRTETRILFGFFKFIYHVKFSPKKIPVDLEIAELYIIMYKFSYSYIRVIVPLYLALQVFMAQYKFYYITLWILSGESYQRPYGTIDYPPSAASNPHGYRSAPGDNEMGPRPSRFDSPWLVKLFRRLKISSVAWLMCVFSEMWPRVCCSWTES